MARIIRTTTSKSRQKVSLRVVFSFLLFMQIQMPDAREMQPEKTADLSFYLTAQNTAQLTLKEEAEETAAIQADKVN